MFFLKCARNKNEDRGNDSGAKKRHLTERSTRALSLFENAENCRTLHREDRIEISGDVRFPLYDTYGFPLDLTELMARERGLTVDVAGFEKLMEEQRARARKAQKKEAISVEEENCSSRRRNFSATIFSRPKLLSRQFARQKPTEFNVVLDRTPCYAEMGGQVGDHGLLHVPGHDRTEVGKLRVADTQKRGDVFIHRAALTEGRAPEPGEAVRISVDVDRRRAIERHHTVTHLLHWALHRTGLPGCDAKGKLRRPGEIDLRFFERGAHARAEARCRETGE